MPVPIIVSHFQFFYESNKVLKKINKETIRKSLLTDKEIQEVWSQKNSISNNCINNKSAKKEETKKLLNCWK